MIFPINSKNTRWKTKLNLDEGLLKTVDWYLNNKNFFKSIKNKKLYTKRLGLNHD